MNPNWKRSEMSLFEDDMITHKTLKLLKELINEFGKVVRYKINLQRSVAFLYTTYKGQKEKLSKQSHLSLH